MRAISVFLCFALLGSVLLTGCTSSDPSSAVTSSGSTVITTAVSTVGSTAVITPSETEATSPSASVTDLPVTAQPPVTTPQPILTTLITDATTPSPAIVTDPIPTAPPTAEPSVPDEPILTEVRKIVYTAAECPIYADISLREETGRLPLGISVLCLFEGETVSVLSCKGGNYYVRTSALTDDVPDEAARQMEEYGGICYPGEGKLIAIDAGHQDHSMPEKEPLGPGSDEMKAKLSSGTQGVATRIPEYELNLAVALKLRDELISRGYGVVMIRESNQVNISNAERAQIANAYGADAFIRIHANGSVNPDQTGAFAICQTKNNPYNGELYAESRRLTKLVCDSFCEATDTLRLSDWETDTMTGINWAEVPVTILEMGYMTHPEEDRKMATEEFRTAAARGIADGLDAYFGGE